MVLIRARTPVLLYLYVCALLSPFLKARGGGGGGGRGTRYYSTKIINSIRANSKIIDSTCKTNIIIRILYNTVPTIAVCGP